MSSCLIITQGNKMYIGADTACSIKTEDGYRRFSDDMPKLFSLGQSVFFCSGKKSDAEKCINWIYDNFKAEIDIEKLKWYLKDTFTVVNKDNVFNVEFLLCDYNNHKVVQLSQYNDFKPMIYDYSDELRILCGGYKTKDSFLMAKKNLILNKPTREIYKDVFENISDECVGGKVILYNAPTSFEIIPLKESDIKYANNDNELFLLTSDFVTSGVVNGSQIIGGDIFSENYSPTTGTHIALNDGSFNFGHKIIYDAETNKTTMRDVTIEWDSTNPPKQSDIEGLEGYLEQLDGRIQTYSQPTDPSINWKTPEDKAKHDGDIWFDTTNGLTKRWNNTTGKWDIVTDSEIKSLAQSKAQIFTSQPIPPYFVGDLWVEGKDGDIWHCIKSKESGSYTASDWEKSSKYTDDAKANEANEKIDNFQSNVNKALNVTLPTNKIGEDYIISPYIGGGYAYIANNDYSVEIDPNHTNSDSNGEYLFCVKDKSISDNSKNVIMGVTNNGNGYFKGDIIANEGSIGGIDITNDRLRSRNTMTEGIVGVQYEASIRKYNPDTENPTKEPAFLIRKRNYDGTNYDNSWEHIFKVTYEGKLTSLDATITGGNIGGFTIDGNSIHSGTWGTEGSVMMCTGTGGSKEIGGSDEISGWCFTAGSKFGVTKNGDVYASNVDITGKINAISGNMDSVTATNLTVTSGTIKLGDATINENGITIAGNQLGTSTISGWKVFNNRIAKLETSVNKGLPVSVGISCDSGNYAFWAGGADANGNASISGTDMDAGKYTDTFKPAFAVRQNGEIIATKGKIGDMSIHSDGSLGGSGMMIYPNGKKYTSFSNTYYISIIYNGRMIALNQNGTWDTIY